MAKRHSRRAKLSRRAVHRLLSATNRGWVLDPILSEREDWSECVRTKRQHEEEENSAMETDSDDLSDNFDE